MRILRSDKHAKSGMEVFVNDTHAASFPSVTPNNDTGGYLDARFSNIHDEYSVIDFENIDLLNVYLKYNYNRPIWWDPENTGIAVDFTTTNLNCIPWKVDTCRYPGP